jgi:hypothetical protein
MSEERENREVSAEATPERRMTKNVIDEGITRALQGDLYLSHLQSEM